MKTLVLNHKSWHYKLAELGGISYYEDTDICEYTRNVVSGLVVATFFCFLGLLIFILAASLIGQFIYQIIFSIWFGSFFLNDYAFAGGILLLTIFLCAFLVFAIIGKIKFINKIGENMKNKRYNKSPKEPGFLAQAYAAHKGKYCFKIKIE